MPINIQFLIMKYYILVKPYISPDRNMYMPRPQPFPESELPKALLNSDKFSEYCTEVENTELSTTPIIKQIIDQGFTGTNITKPSDVKVTVNTIDTSSAKLVEDSSSNSSVILEKLEQGITPDIESESEVKHISKAPHKSPAKLTSKPSSPAKF